MGALIVSAHIRLKRDDSELNWPHLLRHCERSEAIQSRKKDWIASSRSLSSGAHSRDPLTPRNNDQILRPNAFRVC